MNLVDWSRSQKLCDGVLMKAERKVLDFVETMPPHGCSTLVAQEEAALKKLFNGSALEGMSWPHDISPIYIAYHNLALLYSSCGDMRKAVIYTFQWGFAHQRKYGLGAVTALYNLFLIHDPLFVVLKTDAWANQPDCPTRVQFENFYYGILYELLLQSRKAYGEDMTFVKAIGHIYKEKQKIYLECPAASVRSVTRFQAAQEKVMQWAEVDLKRKLTLTPVSTS